MKSIWTIIPNHDLWMAWCAENSEFKIRWVAPEQYPVMVRLVAIGPPGGNGAWGGLHYNFEPVFVYKQEAELLNAMPWVHETYNPKHPFPEIQKGI